MATPTNTTEPTKKKRGKLKWIILAVIALIVIIVIASNSGGSKGKVSDPAPSSGASSSATSSAPASAPKFGQTYTWKDGSAVTITVPETYTPSSSAAGTQGAKGFEIVSVTVKNGTAQPLNPYTVQLQAISGGQQAQEVVDTAKSVGTPSVEIPPGQTLTWKTAFAEAQPGDLSVQAAVGFSDSAVQFTR